MTAIEIYRDLVQTGKAVQWMSEKDAEKKRILEALKQRYPGQQIQVM